MPTLGIGAVGAHEDPSTCHVLGIGAGVAGVLVVQEVSTQHSTGAPRHVE